jgi:hypothetical protein
MLLCLSMEYVSYLVEMGPIVQKLKEGPPPPTHTHTQRDSMMMS